MTCNCQNWDNPNPCPKHGMNKGHQADVEHHVIVVRVWRKRMNKKWYYTISRDSIREFISQDFDTKKEATPI